MTIVATTAETAISDYCGLDCSFLLEQLDFILDMIKMHGDYDAEFAPVMVQKLIDRCNEVKTELMMNALEAKIVH
jgi:hypothetical protein